ncbi:MAG TPA: hypothetical protein DEQ02_01890 [Ruminococcaceae bacterium]|nr:hypothetical protein [Oscillospiraceae bacterium]
MRSIHPYEPYVPQNAEKLIIGTIPPYRFCIKPLKLFARDVNFFYGSRDSAFWELLSAATGKEFDYENTEAAVNQRKDLLRELKIGITDVIKSCIHKDGKSDDKSLEDEEEKKLKKLLSQNSKINTFLYTSGRVKTLMNAFADKREHAWTVPKKRGTVVIDDKKYNVTVLYSPAPSALRGMGKDGAKIREAQYREVFGS